MRIFSLATCNPRLDTHTNADGLYDVLTDSVWICQRGIFRVPLFFVSTSTLLKRGDGVFYGKNPGTYQVIPDALLPIPISTKDDVSASLAEHFKPIDFCSPSHNNGFYLCSYFHTRDVLSGILSITVLYSKDVTFVLPRLFLAVLFVSLTSRWGKPPIKNLTRNIAFNGVSRNIAWWKLFSTLLNFFMNL